MQFDPSAARKRLEVACLRALAMVGRREDASVGAERFRRASPGSYYLPLIEHAELRASQ